MEFIVRKSTLRGSVDIPGSKSHTIRACLLAALADGESTLRAALYSSDTEAAIRVYSALGASFDRSDDCLMVRGIGGGFQRPTDELDVGNSGTTLRVALGSLALMPEGEAVITGDHQIQRRPGGPLVEALNQLGADIRSINGNGCAPFRVRGTLKGGRTSVECKTSQYLTSLLLACPLAANDSEIDVPLLYEKPYVGITLDWLEFLGIKVDYVDDYSHFHIPGRQQFRAFDRKIPADFSTASFFLVAGVLGGNEVTSCGLDLNDSQPDKAVVDYLRAMGASVEVSGDRVTVQPGTLKGVELDLNDTPDALPIMAVAACFAEGETRLVNVPQARIKETDRIAVMCAELGKMGADVEELEAGLVIRGSKLHGARVEGHDDHRVVMSLAIAATQCGDATSISTAEAAGVTVPEFPKLLKQLGGALEIPLAAD